MSALRAILAAIAVAASTSACGAASLAPTFDTGDTTNGDVAAPTSSAPMREVEGTDNGDIDRIAAQTVSEMYTLLGGKLPDGAVLPNVPLTSWDSSRPSGRVICGKATDSMKNAAVCRVPGEFKLGWDRALLTDTRSASGDLGVSVVIAHEMGHVADDARPTSESRVTTLVGEQRADCFAGAYARSKRDANTVTDAEVGKALSAMLAFADPVSINEPSQAGAHGLGSERLYAMMIGYSEDAAACFNILQVDTDERRARFPVASGGAEGDLTWAPSNVGGAYMTAKALIDGNTEQPRWRFDPCLPGDRPATACPDGSVYVTPEALTKYTETVRAEARTRVGDGTAMGPLANVAANLWLQSQGVPVTGRDAGLRAACVAGVSLSRMTVDIYQAPVVLSAGDVDEALTEVLTRGLTTADIDGVVPESVVDRAQAFLAGVYTMTGPGACVSAYPVEAGR